MSLATKVNCVNCNWQNTVDFKAFKNLCFFNCEKCSTRFNLFGVYQSLYNTIALCEKIVSIAVDHTYAKHSVDTVKPQEQQKIEIALTKNDFQQLLRQILHDMILYGNSFIQLIPKDPIPTLQRLEPTELQFKIDWVQEPPSRAFQEKIIEVRRVDDPSIEYDVDFILHFKEGLTLSEPIGDSILGFWFTTWYFLRDLPEAVPLLDMQGEKYSGLKWFRDFKESNVLGAAGIPHNLIFPWMSLNPTFERIEYQRFQYDIKQRRSTISRLVERQLFPKILRREYEYDNFPRLSFSD